MSNQSTNQQASWTPLWVSAIVACAMLVSISSVVLICLAMLPTAVAFIVDYRTPQRYAAFCVGGMNLSGTFPSLIDLWSGSHDIDLALHILSDVFALAVIYGAAAFGWLVYMTIPPVVAAFLTMMAQHRVQQLRAVQVQLVEEWGDVLARRAGTDAAASAPSGAQRAT